MSSDGSSPARMEWADSISTPRRHELAAQPLAVEQLLGLRRRLLDAGRVLVDLRHRIIIVELHAVEAELLVLADFRRKRHLLAHRRAERISPHADVPGAKREPVLAASAVASHSNRL